MSALASHYSHLPPYCTPHRKVKEEVSSPNSQDRSDLWIYHFPLPFQIFGPVLSIGIFKTEDEGITLANNTSYGLGAGLHSSACLICQFEDNVVDRLRLEDDANQCMRVSSALEAGTVSAVSRMKHCTDDIYL